MIKRALLAILLCSSLSVAQQRVYAVVHLYQTMVVGGHNPAAGIFYTTDSGANWEHLGWSNIIAYSLTVDPGSHGKIMYLAAGNGVLKSTDAGKSWRIMTNWRETEVSRLVIDPSNHDILYIATPYGVFKSTDAGWHWTQKTDGINPKQTGTTSSTFIGPILFGEKSNNHLLIGTENGIYKSTNGGNSWKMFALKGWGVRSMVRSEQHPNFLVAGTENGGIFISHNAGKSWTQVKQDRMDTLAVYDVAFQPGDDNVVYAGGYETGMLKSTDGGKTWHSYTEGMDCTTLHSIAVNPKNPDEIFIGTIPGGVYKSVDGGKSWKYEILNGAQLYSVSYQD